MRVLDLTMRVSPEIKVFPGSPQPFFIQWSRLDVHGYDSEVMTMSTHTGTHMDAPSHFARGKKAIDEIPPSRLVCDALLVRLPKKAGQTIGVADIEGEDIRRGDAVVLATGWEKHYSHKDYMTENPGLSKAAARYLARKKVSLVGIDGPSIDQGRDARFGAHNILLPAGVLAVENLCNLQKIKKKKFTLVVAPLNLAGATGSPVRALALV
ncbi:cyclase family protein [Nitrososphaera sp.]|uniref:cyclase family protein n=1 Tax=Nitrososphaera sp. TaxID=1971748 RepID=UPI0017A3B986|nr:cyclase family protein [Nitrososphaera sp.]NWG36084.1 cyclase family protein [Nitrososphaera sp.]